MYKYAALCRWEKLENYVSSGYLTFAVASFPWLEKLCILPKGYTKLATTVNDCVPAVIEVIHTLPASVSQKVSAVISLFFNFFCVPARAFMYVRVCVCACVCRCLCGVQEGRKT